MIKVLRSQKRDIIIEPTRKGAIMKKIPLVILITSLCLFLAACDPSHFTYDAYRPSAAITSVELIEYNNPDVKLINNLYSNREIKRFDFDKMTTIETLDANTIDDFTITLSGIGMWNHWWIPDSPSDICLRVIYENGEFDVISYTDPDGNGYFNRFDSIGKLVKYIGSFCERDSFVELVNNYFVIQIK